MTDAVTAEKRSLSDVMLAMDVVDTLRHRKLLVEKELNSDQREQKLLDRLGEIYASQGIEVSDEVLQAGVDALREERFIYQPPAQSLSVRLAQLYVTRARWGRWAVAAMGGVVVLWLAYGWFISGPAEVRLEAGIAALNGEISTTAERIQVLDQEAGRIGVLLTDYMKGVDNIYRQLATNKLTSVRGELQQAEGVIQQALQLNQTPDLTLSEYNSRHTKVRQQLGEQQQLVEQLDGHLKSAQARLADIDSLKIFPARFKQLVESVNIIAKEKQARSSVQQLYDDGMAALLGGYITEAETALDELHALNMRLLQRYSLLLVARDGEHSGIWRVPERNPNARNYYLIVEAVASDGKVLTMNLINEENGRLVETRKWGLRVNERAYQRVKADKLDDGIIQGRRVGEKRRGYLEPEYLIETSGAIITEW